jgi:hypothetical protein
MRRSFTLAIDGVLVTVREIRVSDFLSAINALLFSVGDLPTNQITPEQWDSALLSGSDCIDCPDNATRVKHADLIRNAFLHVNRDFFKTDDEDEDEDEENTQKYNWDDDETLSALADNINQVCAHLIRLKHPAVFDYGWAFFQTVQDLISESANG